MKKIFIDTDVILDVLAQRTPHYEDAAVLFSLADQGEIDMYISALSIANLHYILSGSLSQVQARHLLLQFKTLVTVLPLTEKVIDLALTSSFRDAEDGLQYFTATEEDIHILITRNIRDYTPAQIEVMTPNQFLKERLLRDEK